MRWHLCRLAMSAFGCSLAATRSHRHHGIAVSHASVSTFSWFCTPRATQSSPKLELLLTFSLPAWKPSSHRTVQLADTRDESGLRCAGDAFQDRVEKESSTDRLQQNSFWSSSGRTRHAREKAYRRRVHQNTCRRVSAIPLQHSGSFATELHFKTKCRPSGAVAKVEGASVVTRWTARARRSSDIASSLDLREVFGAFDASSNSCPRRRRRAAWRRHRKKRSRVSSVVGVGKGAAAGARRGCRGGGGQQDDPGVKDRETRRRERKTEDTGEYKSERQAEDCRRKQ
ncbi:hypothetical protein IWZ00DRAFT_294826 [Phyllosticta capitalensis]|uniref:uncharacterized protein n=1 Tax=Phyllosticta capitalensis TaxID=121624 RepID=UPI00312DD4A4